MRTKPSKLVKEVKRKLDEYSPPLMNQPRTEKERAICQEFYDFLDEQEIRGLSLMEKRAKEEQTELIKPSLKVLIHQISDLNKKCLKAKAEGRKEGYDKAMDSLINTMGSWKQLKVKSCNKCLIITKILEYQKAIKERSG